MCNIILDYSTTMSHHNFEFLLDHKDKQLFETNK